MGRYREMKSDRERREMVIHREIVRQIQKKGDREKKKGTQRERWLDKQTEY